MRGATIERQLEGNALEKACEKEELNNHCQTSVLAGGHLYGFHGQQSQSSGLKCIEFEAGLVKWDQKGLKVGSGLMLANGKLFVMVDGGELLVAEVSPAGLKQLARTSLLSGTCWTVPVVANGRVYCRNQGGGLVSVDLREDANCGPHRCRRQNHSDHMCICLAGGDRRCWQDSSFLRRILFASGFRVNCRGQEISTMRAGKQSVSRGRTSECVERGVAARGESAAAAALVLVLWGSYVSAGTPAEATGLAQGESLQAMVEADWAAQEKRRGRLPQSREAIRDVLDRAARVIEDLRAAPGAPDLTADASALGLLRETVGNLDTLNDTDRVALYHKARSLARDVALKNPRLAGKPVLFMKRRRFVCQMLHEYLGYYYQDIACGGVFVLEEPGRSLKTRDLIRGRLAPGNFATLSLSYDARTVYFAYAEQAAEKPDFYAPQPGRRYFHIYAMGADGDSLRPLTRDEWDDFDPCPLPDGGIAFMSWRRGGFCRCNNPWEPLPSYTLHRMDVGGGNVRTLSFHETNEWHPNVLNDGRIVYIRWDYVDRSAANFHGLWACNPDGTDAVSLFGNYTTRINACYQPRPIPGSNRIAFIAGAHHADVGGSLILLDPTRASLNPTSGQDRFDAIEVLTPEVCFPEGDGKDGGWPRSYFHSPWPLSESHFLIAFSFDPIPGMSSGGKKDTAGIYYLDRFGTLELLYREPGISCMYPLPLAPRPVPPVIPSATEAELGDEGEFLLANVNRSLLPLPAGRPVKELRVFQVLPKTTHIANQPRVGHANAESARMLLGTVPVEADGSAYFRAPARKPLYFQAVDGEGRAVQGMRSIAYVQPGERRGCAGCHEPRGTTPAPSGRTLASSRPPSVIQPGPEGTRPFGYPRLVQPLLERHCVRCHEGTAGQDKSRLVLSGEAAGAFSRSYESLKPFVRWYEWGGQSISGSVTHPGHLGADESRLPRILEDALHAREVRLADEERRRLYIWLDGNAPFYGTYGKEEQAAQKRGEAVPPPRVQ